MNSFPAVVLSVWLAALPGATPTAKPATGAKPVSAQAKQADFSGRWKLDMKRSEFGSLPGGKPVARTDEITHREPEITHVLYLLNGAQRDTARYHYRTGGDPTHSTIDGRDVQSVTKWEGNDLRLDSKTKFVIFDVTLSDRWTLSPDGRTLTMTRHVNSPIAKGDQKLIFTKE